MSYGPVDPNSSPNNQPHQPNNQPYQPNNQPYQPNQQPDSPYAPNDGPGYTPAGQNPPQNQPAYGQMPVGQDQNVWGGNPNGGNSNGGNFNGGDFNGQGPQEPKQSPLKWILIALAIVSLVVGGFFGVRALTGNDDEPDTTTTDTSEATPTPEETTSAAPEETTAPEPEESATTEPEETAIPQDGSGWQGDVFVYTSANGFSVEFPGEPTVQAVDDPFGGDIPMEIIVWESGDDIYQAAFGAQRAEDLTPEASVIGSAEGIGSEAVNLQPIDIPNTDAMTGESEYMEQQVWLLNALSTTDDSVYMLLQSGADRDDAFFDSLEISN